MIGNANQGNPVGNLSVNHPELEEMLPAPLKKNQFFVKEYSEGLLVNEECFATGLFKKVAEGIDGGYVTFGIWELIEMEAV